MLARPRIGPWLSAAIALFATQGVSQSVPAPNIDFSSLGQVAVAGNFDAISIYQYASQREGFNSNGTQSVLTQLPTGFYEKLASTDGSVLTMCPFVLKNGTFVGVMVGGNFTSIAGVDTRSVAMIDPRTFAVTPQVGVQGAVSALFCDQATETVYVGGSFEASISTNAISWVAAGSWANLPFSGFDAPVTSIVRSPNGTIVFGGSFTGIGNSSINIAKSASDTEQQAINLLTANVLSLSNTTSANNIVCPPSNATGASNSPWLLRDNTPGYWQADLRFGFQPSKIRLYNTRQDGRGTKTWRLTALPDGGIMNFTYTDPATGRLAACDASCPLSNNASVEYQEFFFVNRVGMNSIRIDVSEWYGSGGGLAGVQLYQSDIFTYAVPAFNEPACAGISTPANATATGAWRVTPSGNSYADYLTVVTGPTTVGSTQIVFEPDVRQSGNYTVFVYTPGCIQDSSCSARALVNVTGTLTTGGGNAFNSIVSQTNNFDKYDQVFQGRIDASTSSFRPRVTIRPSGFQTDQLVVASRIRFALISSTGGLNGLFEYDPNSATVNTDFSQSAINSVGNKLKPNARILSLSTHGNSIYASGQFTDDVLQNIMSFSNNQIQSLPQGGLNASVLSTYSDNSFLYCAGNFTGTNQNTINGLNNVAAYQYSTSQWVALGNGLDGRVDRVLPMPMNISGATSETVVAFSGAFRNILASGSNPSRPVNGFAIWVPSRNGWLTNLQNVTKYAFGGQLFANAYLPNGTWLGAGTLSSLGQSMNDAASLQSQSGGNARIQQLPIDIRSRTSSPSTSITKRDLVSQQNISGVATGLYYVPNNGARNVTVLAGHFTATGSNSATIDNLLFLNYTNNNAVTGLPQGINTNSSFLALGTANDILAAGGRVSGQVGNARVNGLVLYDMVSSSYRAVQPAPLVGSDVIVKAIAVQDSSSMIYVGGSFESTSQGLACRSVCMYDVASNQWNTVGGQLEGFVSGLRWMTGSQPVLMASGNLSVSGNATGLAVYDPRQQVWSVRGTPAIPGPVSAFTPGRNDGSRTWVAGTANNGSTFLIEIDDTTYRPVTGLLGSGTNIMGLQMMMLDSNHGNSDYLDPGQSLLVTGSLNITGFGTASAALFNGTTMIPFILASMNNGTSGSVNQIFTAYSPDLDSRAARHSTGIAVLVALCAALGTIFLIVLCGILLNYIQRRRAGYNTVPSSQYMDKQFNINRVPPERLFGTLGQRPGGAPTV